MDAAVRSATYIGLLLLMGAGVFARWIGPELHTPGVRRRLWIGLLGGAALLGVGTAVEVATALARALGAFQWELLGAYLLETRHGTAALARAACVLAFIALGLGRLRSQPGERAAHALVGIGVLATFSLTSHAAGLSRAASVIADLIHLAAAAAWGGSLLYVAWLPIWTASPTPALIAAIRRFSRAGFGCVAAMVATGIYASVQQIWGPAALPASEYGRTLLYKIGAVGVVFVLAGVNRWVLMPSLARPDAARRLCQLVRVESLGLVMILGLTGALVNHAPPERPASLAAVTTLQEWVGPWVIHGSMTPRAPQGLDLAFGITDRTGRPAPATLDVTVALTMLDHPMTPVVRRPAPLAAGVYRVGLPLPMAGRWRVSIRLPEGVVDADVQARSSAGVTGWRLDARAVGPGLLYLVFAAGLWLNAAERRGLHSRTGLRQALLGVAVGIAGVVLLVRSQMPATATPTALLLRTNPVPATPVSLARGGEIYRQHCQSCHGVGGAGDGPAAATMDPRPADFRVHMAAGHADGELFLWITDGMTGTTMPPFKAVLSEEDRWHAINYIRTFAVTDR
jgi:putative copper resistance protein D/copper transport protein